MEQLDFFDHTLEKKIQRMEAVLCRFQKELWFLKEVYARTRHKDIHLPQKKLEQLNFFGA